jgi:hypothetical protein
MGQVTRPVGQVTRPVGQVTRPVGQVTRPVGQVARPVGRTIHSAGRLGRAAGSALARVRPGDRPRIRPRQEFIALNGGPQSKFTEAISLERIIWALRPHKRSGVLAQELA